MQLKFMGLPLDRGNITQREILDIINNNKPIVKKLKYEIYAVDDILLIRFL